MSKAKLATKNKAQVLQHLQLRITRLKAIDDEVYRQVIGEIFRRILRQTPQFSGAATAHWVIGVGAPATFYDPNLGSSLKTVRRLAGEVRPLQRGSRYWINVAWNREKGKIATITKGKAIYITNGVLGDTDNGKASPLYLEALQDPAYAGAKLRAVNAPYETVQDSVAWVAARWRGRKINPFTYKYSATEMADES